jgi:hypothetical protein
MYVSNPHTYSPLMYLVHEFTNNQGRTMIGATKRDQIAHDNRHKGIDEGIAHGIAELLNVERAKWLNKWQHFPMVDVWEVTKVLVEIQKRNLEDAALKADLPVENEKREERRQLTQEIDDEFERFCLGLFDKLVHTDELVLSEQSRHRQAVLKGEEEASDEDQAWVRELAEKAEAQRQQLLALLGGTPRYEP